MGNIAECMEQPHNGIPPEIEGKHSKMDISCFS